MESRQFDCLVRALGHGTSRRGALGVLVGALAVLGDTVPGLAKGRQQQQAHRGTHHSSKRHHRQRADKRRTVQASATKCRATKSSNRACAKFCTQVYGAGTAAASQCTSQATKCQGLCYDGCGPRCQAGPCNLERCGQVCCTDPDTCGGGGTSGQCEGSTTCDAFPHDTFAGPPARVEFTVQRAAGIRSIVATKGQYPDGNVDVIVEFFHVGTTDAVEITATKINQAESATVTLSVQDLSGEVVTCTVTF